MRNSVTLVLFLFISVLSGGARSESKANNEIWIYDKVSGVDIFGKHNSNVIEHLNEIYNKVVINIGEKKITITNTFLEDGHVCSTDYVKIKKTPLSYYLSKKTVDMYRQLFKYEDRYLPEDIYIITSIFPGKECPEPYSEIIKANDSLIVSDQNYVLFFKTGKAESEGVKKENWLTYCRNANPGHVYDGSSKELCYFDKLDLKDAYGKLITLNDFGRNYLKKDLPPENYDYKINDRIVNYRWLGGKSLTVSVAMDNEMIKFNFNEQSSGTKLEVTEDTQY